MHLVAYVQIDDIPLSTVPLRVNGTAVAEGKEIYDSQVVPAKPVLTQPHTGTNVNRPTQEIEMGQ